MSNLSFTMDFEPRGPNSELPLNEGRVPTPTTLGHSLEYSNSITSLSVSLYPQCSYVKSIIKLLDKRHSKFKRLFKTLIIYHRNSIFKRTGPVHGRRGLRIQNLKFDTRLHVLGF